MSERTRPVHNARTLLISLRNAAWSCGDRSGAMALDDAIEALAAHPAIRARVAAAMDALLADSAETEGGE